MQTGTPHANRRRASWIRWWQPIADVALHKIDVTNPCAAEEHNIEALRRVKVYNRGGNLVGAVVGLDVEGQESRRAGEEWELTGRLAGTLAFTQIARPLPPQS